MPNFINDVVKKIDSLQTEKKDNLMLMKLRMKLALN